MAVMDEFRKEREAIKKAPFKEKRKYFWDYYKWYCIWGLVILIGLGSLIYDMATNKDTSLYVLFLNSMDATDDYGETFIHDFMETAGMNPKKETVLIDNSLYVDLGYSENMAQNENTLTAVQKISLFLATGDMDIMTTDSAIFDHYAYKYIFHDLREFLPEDVFEKYEPYICRKMYSKNMNLTCIISTMPLSGQKQKPMSMQRKKFPIQLPPNRMKWKSRYRWAST